MSLGNKKSNNNNSTISFLLQPITQILCNSIPLVVTFLSLIALLCTMLVIVPEIVPFYIKELGKISPFLPKIIAYSSPLLFIFFYLTSSSNKTTFQDIDNKKQKENFNITPKEILTKPDTVSCIADAEQTKIQKKEQCDSQHNLFITIIDEFTKQINTFDLKASAMLDYGVGIAKAGIGIFIFSIIGWQIFFETFSITTSTKHYIGMASFSIVFIFLQALAAWCLKQHRAYVDASLYVTKLRSIFERKMQAYLLMKEYTDDKSAYHKLLDNFLEDISWPPEPLSTKQQTSYTKEAAETLTEVTKALKVLQPAQGNQSRPSRRYSSPYSRN